jgi:hypothetical protein
MNFDPLNPKHVEDELGAGYDKSLDVVPFKHHPASFTCANVADGLASFLRDRGFKARKVAGWYGNAERSYHTGISPGLDSASRPRGFGKNPQEHWWVEADGQYIDITSAQFHPLSPNNQTELVIRDKHDAFVSGDYMPVRRFPLGRRVSLPPNASKMIDRILSLKKFKDGHSANPSDNDRLAEWIEKNAPRFSLSLSRAHDLISALRAQTRPGFHFADRRSLESIFGEAYDDLKDDDGTKDASEYVPGPPKTSRGVVRFTRSGLTLNSTYPDDLESNFRTLKDLIKSALTDLDFGEPTKASERGGYGSTIHYISVPLKGADRILSSRDLLDRLKKERFRVG